MHKATPEQNAAMIKVHQLLSIAGDIAGSSNLPWLDEELKKLNAVVRQTHKDANK